MKLIIPTAKIVSPELQKIGKIPPIIYPLSEGIVLDYILQIYNKYNNNIDIVVCEKADLVTSQVYKIENSKINIIKLDEVRDIGFSIYNSLNNLIDGEKNSIIINFADTIVEDVEKNIVEDSYYFSKDFVSEKWTYYEENNGEIISILDKKNISEVKCIKNLFVGVFCIRDGLYFKKCIEESFKGGDLGIDSFYYALMEYSKKYSLKPIEAKKWYDIGHIENYYKSEIGVKAREFNHISIDKSRGILKKTSEDVDKFIGEIKWYLKLPADIEYVRPRIFSYSTSYVKPYIEMEYYSYHTVHELFLYGDLTYNQWENIFKQIRFINRDFSRYELYDEGVVNDIEDMYLNKTIERLNILKNDERFKEFFEKELIVNKIKYMSLNRIIEILKHIIPQKLYNIDRFQIIHGDLCFANILIDENMNFIKVIDPRGRFGKYDIYGDSRYELAKIFHRVDGKYDYIIKDLFKIKYNKNKNTIDYKVINSNRNFDLYECMVKCFNNEIGDRLEEIELIESLLFLSMIPLHNESFEHQLAMLATGLEILDRIIDIKIK